MTDRASTARESMCLVFGGKVYQIADQSDKALATHAGHTVVPDWHK